jgi:hypothetical protein
MDGSLLLQWASSYPQQIIGYRIYTAAAPDAPEAQWQERADIAFHFMEGTDHAGWAAIPLSTLQSKMFFHVRAQFTDTPWSNDGSVYWGTRQLP